MWILDFPSLVLLIVAGFQLGLLGLFGWDAAAVFGAHTNAAYIVAGISAVWQLFSGRSSIEVRRPRFLPRCSVQQILAPVRSLSNESGPFWVPARKIPTAQRARWL